MEHSDKVNTTRYLSHGINRIAHKSFYSSKACHVFGPIITYTNIVQFVLGNTNAIYLPMVMTVWHRISTKVSSTLACWRIPTTAPRDDAPVQPASSRLTAVWTGSDNPSTRAILN